MVRVLVTGASGFIGRRLVESLIRGGTIVGPSGAREKIERLCLADRGPVVAPASDTVCVETLSGDLSRREFVDSLARQSWDSIFHLAASLTLEAERDGDAFLVNVEALRLLIEAAKVRPRVVFASSIAVFGGALPDAVDDDVPPAPQTSYGTHKAVAELLVADASRKGQIDGRCLRLPVVLTRPGAPSPAISDLVAAILREPLAGRDVDIPFDPATVIPVASAGSVVRSLVRLHDLSAEALPPRRTLNMPALSVSIADMVSAVTVLSADRPAATIRYAPDARIQAIVDGWPRRFVSRTATRRGISAETDFREIIRDYLDNLPGGRPWTP